MPMDRQAALQLGLLLLAVPAQYIVSHWMYTTEFQRSYALNNILNNAIGFKDRYLTWRSWHRWCSNIIQNISPYSTRSFEGQDNENGESPAIEVLNYREPKGYFAGSVEPRTPRPLEVKYRVGQVIKHKLWGYRGIIIGWDEYARAPAAWIKMNHQGDHTDWKTQPNYAVLVDTRDRLAPQITYIPQENINIIVNTHAAAVDIREPLLIYSSLEKDLNVFITTHVDTDRLVQMQAVHGLALLAVQKLK